MSYACDMKALPSTIKAFVRRSAMTLWRMKPMKLPATIRQPFRRLPSYVYEWGFVASMIGVYFNSRNAWPWPLRVAVVAVLVLSVVGAHSHDYPID